jgi:DNA modification methylase
MSYTLHTGKSEVVLKDYPDNYFDSCVTDSPYGIRFMGKPWDDFDISKKGGQRDSYPVGEKRLANGLTTTGFGHSIEAGKYDLSPKAMRAFQEWFRGISVEIFRVLKPGGHFLNFSSPRTYHRMACGAEESGFEIRDQIMWVFASGFPKSHNLNEQFDGWGTALKPAHEPIMVARKPLIGTVKANMEQFGVGALNIDGCRIELNGDYKSVANGRPSLTALYDKYNPDQANIPTDVGRWPANLILDGSPEVIAGFPSAVGPQNGPKKSVNTYGDYGDRHTSIPRLESNKSASRFFYNARISPTDRNEGLPDGLVNNHPTVKPTDLMRYLLRLVTPKYGITLDPFRGSGSTGKAAAYEWMNFVGIDMDQKWEEVSRYRIEYALRHRDIQLPLL